MNPTVRVRCADSQKYHAALLVVLNAQRREGFERTGIAKRKNTTQLSQEKQNLLVAKGSR
jgi:hypothetical protein